VDVGVLFNTSPPDASKVPRHNLGTNCLVGKGVASGRYIDDMSVPARFVGDSILCKPLSMFLGRKVGVGILAFCDARRCGLARPSLMSSGPSIRLGICERGTKPVVVVMGVMVVDTALSPLATSSN
jgi:hypothetical protein